ncbi:MAG TPA: hypothetical protein VFL16_10470, partial [Steroidobacteraceae bacterium]|nr:hypothetical protein [Steroidobacteraceae bacterium]
ALQELPKTEALGVRSSSLRHRQALTRHAGKRRRSGAVRYLADFHAAEKDSPERCDVYRRASSLSAFSRK